MSSPRVASMMMVLGMSGGGCLPGVFLAESPAAGGPDAIPPVASIVAEDVARDGFTARVSWTLPDGFEPVAVRLLQGFEPARSPNDDADDGFTSVAVPAGATQVEFDTGLRDVRRRSTLNATDVVYTVFLESEGGRFSAGVSSAPLSLVDETGPATPPALTFSRGQDGIMRVSADLFLGDGEDLALGDAVGWRLARLSDGDDLVSSAGITLSEETCFTFGDDGVLRTPNPPECTFSSVEAPDIADGDRVALWLFDLLGNASPPSVATYVEEASPPLTAALHRIKGGEVVEVADDVILLRQTPGLTLEVDGTEVGTPGEQGATLRNAGFDFDDSGLDGAAPSPEIPLRASPGGVRATTDGMLVGVQVRLADAPALTLSAGFNNGTALELTDLGAIPDPDEPVVELPLVAGHVLLQPDRTTLSVGGVQPRASGAVAVRAAFVAFSGAVVWAELPADADDDDAAWDLADPARQPTLTVRCRDGEETPLLFRQTPTATTSLTPNATCEAEGFLRLAFDRVALAGVSAEYLPGPAGATLLDVVAGHRYWLVRTDALGRPVGGNGTPTTLSCAAGLPSVLLRDETPLVYFCPDADPDFGRPARVALRGSTSITVRQPRALFLDEPGQHALALVMRGHAQVVVAGDLSPVPVDGVTLHALTFGPQPGGFILPIEGAGPSTFLGGFAVRGDGQPVVAVNAAAGTLGDVTFGQGQGEVDAAVFLGLQ